MRFLLFFVVILAMMFSNSFSRPPKTPGPDPSKHIKIFFDESLLDRNVSSEEAKKFIPPPELKFELYPKATIGGSKLFMNGSLINRSVKDFEIIVFPVGNTNPFYIEFDPSEKIEKISIEPPLPQQSPPRPAKLLVPSFSTIGFSNYINLAEYKPETRKKVKINWTFYYWNEPRPSGTIEVILHNE